MLGTLPQIAAASPVSYIAMDKLTKQYGDLMSVKMGMVDAGQLDVKYQLKIYKLCISLNSPV